MYKIGITGVMGAGKTTLGLILEKEGLDFISSDLLAKQAFSPDMPSYTQLLQLLGPQFLDNTGYFDHQKLAQALFKDPQLLSQVETIIHPFVWKKIEKKIKEIPDGARKLVFIEVPLLFEKGWKNRFDTVILVATEPKMIELRLNNQEEVEKRMQFQMSQEEKIKRADHVIWNVTTVEDLRKKTLMLLKTLKKKED